MFMQRGLQFGEAWFQMVVFGCDDVGAKCTDAIFETKSIHVKSVLQVRAPMPYSVYGIDWDCGAGALRESGSSVLAKIGSTLHNRFDRLQQARYFVLPTKPLDPCSSRLCLQLLGRLSGYHQNEHVRVSIGQVAGRFKPVHLGHDEVHQCEMRRVKVKCRQRVLPVKRFPNYKPFRTLLQCRLESATCRRTVIDYKDTDQANPFRCRRSCSGRDSPSVRTQYAAHPRITRIRLYEMRDRR
jgi:hypothetical protein